MTVKQVNSNQPIFVMKKKKLLTGMTDRMLGLTVAALLYWYALGFTIDFSHFTLDNLAPVLVLVGFVLLFNSGLHDLLVRQISCYEDHIEIKGALSSANLSYDDIKSFIYTYTGAGTAATLLKMEAPIPWAAKVSNSKQFTNEELARLAFILRSHGVAEIHA